jgi:hypothetical protein
MTSNRGTLAPLSRRQRSHIIDQTPNILRGLNFAEARHHCESDAVVDDPKQLLIGIVLHSLASEIRGAGTSTVLVAFEPGRRRRGIRHNLVRNVYLPFSMLAPVSSGR